MGNTFITLLERNFSPTDKVQLGENKKFINEKSGNKFGRDFIIYNLATKTIGSYLSNRMQKDKEYGDFYVCFTPFEGERLKANAKDSFIIAMDIDGAPIPTDLPPSYYWETSPNKFQGVWVLDNKVTPQEQEEINRKMVKMYNFDPASCDVIHFYRIPGTLNFKYATPFKVSGMKGDGTVYRKRDVVKHLKDVDISSIVSIDEGEIELDEYLDLEEIIEEYQIGNEFRQVLATDRSDWAWNIESKMIKQSATKEEVKFILLNAPKSMQKFTYKNVDQEVHRVFAKIESELENELDMVIEPDKPKEKVSGHDKGLASLKQVGSKGQKQVSQGVTIKQYKDIEDYDDSNAWLVEGIWANESVGLIGAPSKSFKSTLTINLACAVASGQRFDGREVKQGGVLILQGENNLAIEKQKIYSITGEEDLPIYFVDSFMTMDMVFKLKSTIKELGIKLFIIDPMYLLFGSGDINKHQDITQRLSMLTKLRDETGCSIILVHHSRKLERGGKISTSDMYGSAFIEGWYESMILLQRNGVQSSAMTTYFRNHKSGDKYTLLVNDNMGCKVIPMKDEDGEYSEDNQASPKKLKKKES